MPLPRCTNKQLAAAVDEAYRQGKLAPRYPVPSIWHCTLSTDQDADRLTTWHSTDALAFAQWTFRTDRDYDYIEVWCREGLDRLGY